MHESVLKRQPLLDATSVTDVASLTGASPSTRIRPRKPASGRGPWHRCSDRLECALVHRLRPRPTGQGASRKSMTGPVLQGWRRTTPARGVLTRWRASDCGVRLANGDASPRRMLGRLRPADVASNRQRGRSSAGHVGYCRVHGGTASRRLHARRRPLRIGATCAGVEAIRDGGPSRHARSVLTIRDRVRADAAHWKSEERFRALVAATSDVVYRMTRTGAKYGH